MTYNHFKSVNSYEKRIELLAKKTEKYPTLIPVIFQPIKKENLSICLQTKFLVNPQINVGQFLKMVRPHFKLSKLMEGEKAIFIFINSKIPNNTSLMSTVAEQNTDTDGFLYIFWDFESVFG